MNLMGEIIDGKKVSEFIKEDVKKKVSRLKGEYGIIPCLYAVLVGDDPASNTYVKNKKKACESLGMISEIKRLPENTTHDKLMDQINRLNEAENVHGILVQLPLPKQIKTYAVMEAINPMKDVDGFTMHNIARLRRGEDCFEPCTPKGIFTLLDQYGIKTEGKDVVILGRSDIVGKPLYDMMGSKKRNATVTLCNSYTKSLEDHTKRADILISAIGKPQYITGEMIKEGAVVIDVGINRIDGKLVGDVNFESAKEKAAYITPVPGGVGPMTITSLMENTLKAARILNGLEEFVKF